ncbi:hypothetical protein B0G84_1049 [Paraburkholderia sp. BL8N3]|nr:hypothetical protein B0G84_1049 [Paraburkholderia sp. BL8N3]
MCGSCVKLAVKIEAAHSEQLTRMELLADDLKDTRFAPDEAIFVIEGAQVEFLMTRARDALEQVSLIPLSLHAYAAARTYDHPRIEKYHELIDFAACERDYHDDVLGLSSNWLQQLGLDFWVEGIDLAELDAPAQFLFFLHAKHIARVVKNVVAGRPDIKTFYAIVGGTMLPLDYYFDSDVTAAIARHICESFGRRFVCIIAPERPRHILPSMPPGPAETSMAVPVLPPAASSRVGFAPATVRNAEQLRRALHESGHEVVLFPSKVWGMPPLGAALESEREFEVFLSSSEVPSSADYARDLGKLRDQIMERRARSLLPGCIVDNPYLQFQFDHIVTRRWLGYANLIRRAVDFVKATPLDLFIHCQHFTAEGAILARLYERKGTRIMATQHSGWPVDPNWLSPRHARHALAWTRSSMRRIQEYDRNATVYVTGAPDLTTFRDATSPLLHDRVSKVRQEVGGRKIVLLLTNALELHCIPFTDLGRHFETLSELAAIPAEYAESVVVLIRAKPAPVGEDPILYEKLSGFDPGSHTGLSSLDFSECLDVADCIVGVNVPTTGYFEALERSVPLIHVQTCAALSLHPDLPPEAIVKITDVKKLWQAIGAALFDSEHRSGLLQRQLAFLHSDRKPTFGDAPDPLRGAIDRVLTRRARFDPLRLFRRNSLRRAAPEVPSAPVPDIATLPVAQTVAAGHIDRLLVSSDDRTVIVEGWAVAQNLGAPARRIHAFASGVWRGARNVSIERTDIVAVFDDPRLLRSGFALYFRLDGPFKLEHIAVYSELPDGTFFQLTLPAMSELRAK